MFSIAWATLFATLALQRHVAGGSHAEDLGFTDQVLWNFLPPRMQWFRMSMYAGAAAWNTELDIARIARPDSLLAFHFEPLLLALLPFYALGGIGLILVLQAVALAAGAIPAYRLGRHAARGSQFAGVGVAAAYLLSPLGQWVALADVHTTAFAAPLLLLAAERWFVAHKPKQALVAAVLAASAREDIGIAVAALGAVALARAVIARRRAPEDRHDMAALAFIAVGIAFTGLGALVIRAYSGGVSPFEGRYADALQPNAVLALLTRPSLTSYALTLLASGGWLGLLAPITLLPALPSLALNVLSSSEWMASGKAHYSAVVLPFVAIGAAGGLGWLARAKPSLIRPATLALLATSTLGYVSAGAGPLGANFAPGIASEHAARAAALSASLPRDAAVSASTALVPRLSERTRVYVFPAVLDADYVFADLQSTPAPTSAGDVYLRLKALLEQGDWQVDAADDGLLLLEHAPGAPPTPVQDVAALVESRAATPAAVTPPSVEPSAAPQLMQATLVPSPDAAIDVDGPRWILRTVWRADTPSPPGTRLSFVIHLRDAPSRTIWDVADLWWNPPDRWPPGTSVTIDVPGIPRDAFESFEPIFTPPVGMSPA